MSSFASSPDDEFGTGGSQVGFRRMEDIADDKGDYFLIKDGISVIDRKNRLNQDKPLILRAGEFYRFLGHPEPWLFTEQGETMIKSFPLKSGEIVDYTDNTNTIVNTREDHGLNVNDVVRIMDARVAGYNGEQTIIAVTADSFTIDVPFNGVDGESRFVQSQLYVETTSLSSLSGAITEAKVLDGGEGYQNSETVDIIGTGTGGTATITTLSNSVIIIAIVTPGTGYVDGETVTLTGQTSGATTATATVTAPIMTTLNMTNHQLDDNITIQIGAGGPPPPPGSFRGAFIISNVTADTVDVEFDFVAPVTTVADTGIGVVEFMVENMARAGGPGSDPDTLFMSVDESHNVPVSGVTLTDSVLFSFGGAEYRGLNAVNFTVDAGLVQCTNIVCADVGVITINNSSASAPATPVFSQEFASCFRLTPESQTNRANFNSNGLGFGPFNSFIEIPPLLDNDTVVRVVDNSSAAPGTHFSLGYIAIAVGDVSDDGGNISIPLADATLRFRVGDTIEVLASTSYTGMTGVITSINKTVSITVDIPFTTTDTDITIRDNTLASRDQTDPQIEAILNGELQDSVNIANVFLPFDANITVPIITANVPELIGGTWESSMLERFEFVESGGILTFIGTSEIKLLVAFGATLSGSASNIFGIHIFQNGADITDTPPLVDIINAGTDTGAGGSQIVTFVNGDTMELAVSNLQSTQDPTVHQAHITITAV